MENVIEDLIDLHGNYDRMVLRWLCHQVGERKLGSTVAKLAHRNGSGGKPDLPTVCRALGVRPPGRQTRAAGKPASSRTARDRSVGDRYLARIRQILDTPKDEPASRGKRPPAGEEAGRRERKAAPVRQESLPFGASLA